MQQCDFQCESCYQKKKVLFGDFFLDLSEDLLWALLRGFVSPSKLMNLLRAVRKDVTNKFEAIRHIHGLGYD